MIWDANSFHMEELNANEKERVVGSHKYYYSANSFKSNVKVDFGVGHGP